MLKLSYIFIFWISIIFFTNSGWMNSLGKKKTTKNSSKLMLYIKGCTRIMNLTDIMFYCLEYEWMCNIKYNSVFIINFIEYKLPTP